MENNGKWSMKNGCCDNRSRTQKPSADETAFAVFTYFLIAIERLLFT